MAEQRGLALGIDLGGTSVKAGVVSHTGEIISRASRPTEVTGGVDTVIKNMIAAANEAAANAGLALRELDGVGVGAPGTCDAAHGVVVQAVNLFWRNVPVVKLLREQTGLPAFVDNDANCAALGEQWCGAAKGSKHVVLLTVGTGVGGGLILNGQIYQGFSGWAGEVGHMPAVENGPHCNCGQNGCVETVASATAIINHAKREIEAGRAAFLAQRVAEQGGAVDARHVVDAARDGDAVSLAILRQAGEYLGVAVASLVGALNPELVVIGGGVSRAGDLLLEPVRQTMAKRAMPGPAAVTSVVPALLGNDAGLIGAASLVWR